LFEKFHFALAKSWYKKCNATKKLPPLFNESFAGYWSRTSFCDIEAFASVWKSK